jgi:AcrR family transcriptional regulator
VSAVLAATVDVLTDRGYRGFSISEVALRSGVHETSIYRRWPTKAQLVTEAIVRHTAQSSPPPDTGSLREDLYTILRSVIDRLRTPLGQAVSQLVVSQDADLADLRREYWNSRLEGMRQVVIRARARGEVPTSLDPRLVLEMSSGSIMLRSISGQVVSPGYIRKLVDRIVPALSAELSSR